MVATLSVRAGVEAREETGELPELEPPASLLVRGLPALTLRGVVTTPSGTAALPPPKLATLPFSCAPAPLGWRTPPSPNEPTGMRGAASAFFWNLPILSEILPWAPVCLGTAELATGAVDASCWRLSRAMRS